MIEPEIISALVAEAEANEREARWASAAATLVCAADVLQQWAERLRHIAEHGPPRRTAVSGGVQIHLVGPRGGVKKKVDTRRKPKKRSIRGA